MRSDFISYKSSHIHYRYSGEGAHVVVCFHGFGTFARTFDWLAEHVPGQCFVAFDLPWHGETKWNEGPAFLPEDLLAIMDLCPRIPKGRISLMGYSMGGRVALQLLQEIPERVDRLVLLAPDGLHLNPWYWFATQTSIGNFFFRKVMNNPTPFVRILHRASNTGLLNKGVMKFVDRYLEDQAVREQVYRVWTAFRKFKPSLPYISRIINRLNIPVTLVYGRYDTIIPLAPGEKFFHTLKGKRSMQVLETGHQVLHPRNAPYIAEAFNHQT